MWSYVAARSFGGPAGQISVIHKKVVDDKKILNEEEFLHALNFCMLLPGPEAQQLATYVGWLTGGVSGGLRAGLLFILPGFLSILFLSLIYVTYHHVPFVEAIFYGIKPAMVVVVASALIRISSRALKNTYHFLLAMVAFIGLYFFNVPFPLVVLGAGIVGLLEGRLFAVGTKNYGEVGDKIIWLSTIKTAIFWIGIWMLPIFLILLLFGNYSIFQSMNVFFSKMSLVTFGGAYAALNYVAQKAVNVYGWLSAAEMMNGLAMAESTPGPLIQSVQFVAFLGAFRAPEGLAPYSAGILASLLATWMTFAPCFMWIFTFAPYVEALRRKVILNSALQAITAAVVGVVANLSFWFFLKTIFQQSERVTWAIFNFEWPIWSSIDWWAFGIAGIIALLQFQFKKGLFTLMGVSVVLGIIIKLFFT